MKVIAVYLLLLAVCNGSCYNSKLFAGGGVNAGEQCLYSYSSEGTGYSDIQMLYNTDSSVKAQSFFYRPSLQTMQVNIQCNIKKTITEYSGNTAHVCFEIVLPLVKIENNALPVDADIIMQEMILPVFADMTVDGNILAVKTDTAVSYLTAGIIRSILSNIQAVIPSEKEQGWQTPEENTIGVFKANYQVVNKSGDSIEYRKTNMGYEKITAAKKGQHLFPDSRSAIITNAYGLVQRISTSESLITLFGRDTIVASGSSTEYKLLRITNIKHEDLLALKQLERSGQYLKSVTLSDPISDEDINRMAYKNTLGDENFETLTEKLRLVTLQDKQYESELVKKIRALAWLHEADCSKMAAILKEAAVGSDTFRVISHSLATVETPFSINELAAVIALRRNDEAVMIELLPVMATTPAPTGKAADIIKELAFSKKENAFIMSTAQLALGGMVKNLMKKDSAKANELIDIISENMKNSPDTLQLLLVYGNTGAYRLLPVISSYISGTSVSPEIRKAAVFATRLIDHKEVTSLLGKLAVNKDTVLSKAANETILFRNEYLHENL
jgi:hypothetical protein